jgi:hypothetical protein
MNETDILKEELQHYKNEKDKIRKIIGQIGGTTSIKHTRRVNIIFLVIVLSLFLFDVLRELLHLQISGYSSNLAIEFALLLVSVKIIWMINKQSKIDHFQFWVLNSIEFQINSIAKKMRELEQTLISPEQGDRQESSAARCSVSTDGSIKS